VNRRRKVLTRGVAIGDFGIREIRSSVSKRSGKIHVGNPVKDRHHPSVGHVDEIRSPIGILVIGTHIGKWIGFI
jgi:hypothetical protein